MKIADIFIGKPGDMTASEAITADYLCVVSPIFGQEKINSDHLLEEGIAVKSIDLTTLLLKLDRLLEDLDKLAQMKPNAFRFAQTL